MAIVMNRMLHKAIVLMLSAVILLPTEEDGVFDSAFLDLKSATISHKSLSATKSEHHSVSDPELVGMDDNALFTRSRCDFLDLVFENFFTLSQTKFLHFSNISISHTFHISSLLSDLLLNLPPPIV